METTDSINKLIKSLRESTNEDDIFHILKSCSISITEWAKYAYWKENERYSRNLIHDEEGRFQMFLICWQPRQGNEPHHHMDSKCFFKVLHGRILETFYPTEDDASISRRADKEYDRGEVCYLERTPVFHSLKNTSMSEKAVTLHVYIKPTSTNEVYNKKDKSTSTTDLSFISEYGRPVVDGCKAWDIPTS
ncbi:hypothetical protein Btru_009004 [Bulinus truncatus]|nr:hypothetical protein Btru_009004 [Bulinus truncatus]